MNVDDKDTMITPIFSLEELQKLYLRDMVTRDLTAASQWQDDVSTNLYDIATKKMPVVSPSASDFRTMYTTPLPTMPCKPLPPTPGCAEMESDTLPPTKLDLGERRASMHRRITL